jgi:predicted RNA-binding protein associated with RNAse of E/G family
MKTTITNDNDILDLWKDALAVATSKETISHGELGSLAVAACEIRRVRQELREAHDLLQNNLSKTLEIIEQRIENGRAQKI